MNPAAAIDSKSTSTATPQVADVRTRSNTKVHGES